jgi:hypothetical protein
MVALLESALGLLTEFVRFNKNIAMMSCAPVPLAKQVATLANL